MVEVTIMGIIFALVNLCILFQNIKLLHEWNPPDPKNYIFCVKTEMEIELDRLLREAKIDVMIDGVPHRAEIKIIGVKADSE